MLGPIIFIFVLMKIDKPNYVNIYTFVVNSTEFKKTLRNLLRTAGRFINDRCNVIFYIITTDDIIA